jgi:hypothetical protein
MTTTHITFDTRSGRILSVHQGATNPPQGRAAAHAYTQYQGPHDTKISDEHVATITVPYDAVEPGKQYKVDVSRKTLVATEGKGGVGFGFGVTARSSR